MKNKLVVIRHHGRHPQYSLAVRSSGVRVLQTPRRALVASPVCNKAMLVSYLVVWKQQRVCNNHVLPPTSCKHDHLGDIIRRQRIAATVPN
jgi:hypothetical protein